MQQLKRWIDPASFFAALYVGIVWLAYSYLNITTYFLFLLLVTIGITVFSYGLFVLIHRLIALHTPAEYTCFSFKKKIILFFVFVIISLLLSLLWLRAFYPGSYSTDSFNQYGQAMSGEYNDWHPAWHTFVFFTIPIKIFKNITSVVVLQFIYFSIVIGFMVVTVAEMLGITAAVFSAIYILFNPYVYYVMLFPWKDTAFSLGGLFCLICAIRLYYHREKKTPKIWMLAFFGLIMASTTLFRHNGILFTGPLMVVIILNTKPKIWIKLLVFTLVAYFIIKVPVYSIIGVEKPGRRVVEATGLPLTVLGNVVKDTPDLMDEELQDFAYAIAPQEQWEEYYERGNFNFFKWSGVDTTIVEETGYVGMLKIMHKCFKLSPKASWKAVISLTDIIYGFETGLEGNARAELEANDYGIGYPEERPTILIDSLQQYAGLINDTIFRYTRTYGIAIFVMLFTTLCGVKFKSWNSWKKAFYVVPILCYDFGTMLLLTGPDSRFFYITFLVTPITVLFSFCKEEKIEK